MRRFVYLGLALGLTIAFSGGIATLPACYNVPRPICGFHCGSGGACPADYTCSSLEPRCHLNGTDPAMLCDSGDDGADAAIDSPIDTEIDAAIDAPIDMAIDAAIDSPIDAAIDSPIDAAIDSPIDAAIDSPVDSTLDAPTD